MVLTVSVDYMAINSFRTCDMGMVRCDVGRDECMDDTQIQRRAGLPLVTLALLACVNPAKTSLCSAQSTIVHAINSLNTGGMGMDVPGGAVRSNGDDGMDTGYFCPQVTNVGRKHGHRSSLFNEEEVAILFSLCMGGPCQNVAVLCAAVQSTIARSTGQHFLPRDDKRERASAGRLVSKSCAP